MLKRGSSGRFDMRWLVGGHAQRIAAILIEGTFKRPPLDQTTKSSYIYQPLDIFNMKSQNGWYAQHVISGLLGSSPIAEKPSIMNGSLNIVPTVCYKSLHQR